MARPRNPRPKTITNSEKIRDNINGEVGKRIRMYRSGCRYTQEGLAEAVNISVSTLKQIENGFGIKIDNLYLLSLVLDVDISDLLGL